jgi:photosystem II stability/assembly factor-like uncharacterized protein
MKNILILVLLFAGGFVSNGQIASLEDKLQGKKNLEEIMTIVNAHYQQIDQSLITKTNEPNYKHWARWSLYMSSRTDTQGNLTNITDRISEVLDQTDRHHTTRASTGNWSFLGPKQISDSGNTNSAIGIGRVDRIAFHPTDADIMYIGTPAGGLYKTTNGGTTWNPISNRLPSTGISGIVVSHNNPNRIYILTGDGDSNISGFVEDYGYIRFSAGAYVSHDAGSNWYKLADLPVAGNYVGYQLAQDPNNANVLIAATSAGIFQTTNAGQSWSLLKTGRTYELKYKPGSSNIIYATQSGAFFRSTNGGASFDPVGFSPSLPGGRIALAITEAAPNWVYILCGGGSSGATYGGLYLSTNSGASFAQMSNAPNVVDAACAGDGSANRTQSSYDLALGVSHTFGGTMVTGAINSWGSTNLGINFVNRTPQCGNSASTGYLHADIHDIEYNPLTDEVFVCSDGGLNKSDNHGVDWISLSNGISASQIYHMAGSNVSTTNMMIGLQDNGIKSRDAVSTTWTHRSGADGFDCIYNNNSSTAGYFSRNQSIISFTNNGGTRVDRTPALPGGGQWFGRVSRANNNSNIVLAGYTDIMRSTNGGVTWSNRGANGNWDIEHCPSNNNRFYAVGGSASNSNAGRSFHRSDDAGLTWTTLVSGSLPSSALNLKVTDIGVRPNLSTNVWLVFGGFGDGQKVYFSNNQGVSFTNMSGTLPNVPINCIVLDGSNNAYIGTDIGVYYRGASMSDWVPFWSNLPIVPVTDLELYESNGFIRAATFGKGVYQSDTYSACVANINLNANFGGNLLYEASSTITSTSTLSGAANTQVIMKAGQRVTLSPGFRASRHTDFRAYIMPCGEYDLE